MAISNLGEDKVLDIISKQAQSHYHLTPVIILGSGASAAHGMAGMWELSQHLIQNVNVSDLEGHKKGSWDAFCQLLNNNVDLESALHKVSMCEELTTRIVRSTWELLSPQDNEVFKKSLCNDSEFPLGRLLNHMLSSTIKEVDIITTNYDNLAEYACEQEELYYYTGFSPGYRGRRIKKNYLKSARQVNIWKVHGSLGWFSNKDGIPVSLSNLSFIPDDYIPLIITPGIEKYKSTHREPYKSTIHSTDDVIEASKSYLCIGFGFNDQHIQEKLVNKCVREDAAIVIIAKKLTESAKNFLFEKENIKYLAIEESKDASKSQVYSSHFDGNYELPGDYWSIKGFMKLID